MTPSEALQLCTETECDPILEGLFEQEKWIHPKFFYDQRGSELYDLITDTPEYYPTRTELRILSENRQEIARHIKEAGSFLEIGAGAIEKTATLLGDLKTPIHYVAVDIAKERLRQSALAVKKLNPLHSVSLVEGDFTQPLERKTPERGLVFFPGSTIGNFDPCDAAELLRSLGQLTSPTGGLLVGVDLIKNRKTLEAAYNDASGVTAEFNLNLVRRLRALADFPLEPEDFMHRAFFNEEKGRIEMHLVATRDLSFTYGHREFSMSEGESIHTENSYKYSLESFDFLARKAGFSVEKVWRDAESLFSLQLLKRIAKSDRPDFKMQPLN
jgi:dimethylhistidine N-methyltransferase